MIFKYLAYLFYFRFQLQRVECIDVAEQALAALELLSRRHGKNILNAVKFTTFLPIDCQKVSLTFFQGGISACLQYIDFFSMSSQRSALQIVANCCLHMTNEDFLFLSDCLSSLSQRLASQVKVFFIKLTFYIKSPNFRIKKLSN